MGAEGGQGTLGAKAQELPHQQVFKDLFIPGKKPHVRLLLRPRVRQGPGPQRPDTAGGGRDRRQH